MFRLLVTLAALLSFAGTAAADQQTYDHWHDGKAELAGYDLVQPRYGEPRRGTAVMIFVSEPFSDSMRVKADPGRHPPSDVYEVLKLNYVKDFQTGIYDYNLMISAFVTFEGKDGRRAGAPTKIAFSAQEWCGMMFDQLLFRPKTIERQRFSYFDGEGDQEESLSYPKDALTVDELPVLVRGIPDPLLAPGEEKRFRVLPSLERARLLHRPLAWVAGTLERKKGAKMVRVPAGELEVEEWVLTLESGERYSYQVERAFPHRLVAWTGPDGEQGRLRGSERLRYWELNGEGHERALERIGLTPR